MFAPRTFTERQKSEARRRYQAGESLVSIARFLKVSDATLRKYRLTWGWGERLAASGPGAALAIPPEADGSCAGEASSRDNEAAVADTHVLSRRVEAAVRRELAGIEKRLGSGADASAAERNARVLASLVKSLAELARIDTARKEAGDVQNESNSGDADTEDRRPPRDLAELREELAARLERLRAERAAGAGD